MEIQIVRKSYEGEANYSTGMVCKSSDRIVNKKLGAKRGEVKTHSL